MTLAVDLNIAVDFIDEDQLLDAKGLSAFKLLVRCPLSHILLQPSRAFMFHAVAPRIV
jgi:hypothetical protein